LTISRDVFVASSALNAPTRSRRLHGCHKFVTQGFLKVEASFLTNGYKVFSEIDFQSFHDPDHGHDVVAAFSSRTECDRCEALLAWPPSGLPIAQPKTTNIKINYQSVGSGLEFDRSGRLWITVRRTPLKDSGNWPAKASCNSTTVIGSVVPVVNIGALRLASWELTGVGVLGDIHLRPRSQWNDPALKALNPGLALPDAAIAPVRQQLWYQFYLHQTLPEGKVNSEWKSKVGERGTAVNWPVSVPVARGSRGRCRFRWPFAELGGLPGICLPHQTNKLTYALMKMQTAILAMTLAAFKAAAAYGAQWAKSFTRS
jgi:hypothetical protein